MKGEGGYNFRKDYEFPEERNLHKLRGGSLEDAIEHFEGPDEPSEIESSAGHPEQEDVSVFDGFLKMLREKGIRISTPEWLQFLKVVQSKTKPDELQKVLDNQELLHKIRLYAQVTLIKNKADEAAFHEAFDQYFQLAAKVFTHEVKKEEQKQKEEDESRDSGTKPEIKEQLGIKEAEENLDLPENQEHADNEQVHGGKQDQHNDILKKADLSKQGGGSKKEAPSGEGDKGEPSQGKGELGGAGKGKGDKGEAGQGKGDKGQPSGKGKGGGEEKTEDLQTKTDSTSKTGKSEQHQFTEQGILVGGGKGKSRFAERATQPITHEGEKLNEKLVEQRKEKAGKVDRRQRYEVRPDRASMREVIRNIRRIILDVSEIKSRNINIGRTVKNFAKRDFHFEYEKEREKQPEIVLFIDVGGPVDEWSPLVKKMTEAMAEGLTKLEIYLFHNNLYGYVWKPDPKDLHRSSYAKPNSLIDVKSVIKKRKKVIIYGDAEMSYSEFEGDGWPPSGNNERIRKFGMGGEECLQYIQKHSDSAVWINPAFKKEWQERDDSGTINAARSIIPMYDLTVGGVEDAVKELMKK